MLAKAFFNTAQQLNLTQTQLAVILGVSQPTISRLKTQLKLDLASKQGELALLLIKLYTALYDLNGGDLDWILHFLNSKNRVTGGVPVEQIETARGLVSVLQFVEAIRGN
ncbi:XRE family transcriptional regulator (plasmid) [Acinetobacter sp. A1-4-2]|uniref:XRE family transcriptional regulator n=1 Tax=Acinetobacter sp. A1-4-2 TaxID=3156489 RepID=A0AAU7T1P4_9GAMM